MKKIKSWNWYFILIFFVRTVWFLVTFSLIEDINYYDVEINHGILFFGLLIPFLGPFFFYRPGNYNRKAFIISEMIFAGILFVFFTDAFRNWAFFSLSIAFMSRSKDHKWSAPTLLVVVIFLSLLTGKFLFFVEQILVDFSLFYGIGFALSRLTETNESNKQLIKIIKEKNDILEQYANKIEQLTIQEERNRMARELHDTAGHVFTTVITGLDALPFLIRANSTEVEETIGELANVARKGLEEIRNSVHQMSIPDNSQNILESLQDIIEDFSKHTSTQVDLHISGNQQSVSSHIKHIMIRCLQEALTNSIKHGEANNIIVTLRFSENRLTLVVEDDGQGDENLSYGFGLSSMKERLEIINGMIDIKSKKTGTTVICKIPIVSEVFS